MTLLGGQELTRRTRSTAPLAWVRGVYTRRSVPASALFGRSRLARALLAGFRLAFATLGCRHSAPVNVDSGVLGPQRASLIPLLSGTAWPFRPEYVRRPGELRSQIIGQKVSISAKTAESDKVVISARLYGISVQKVARTGRVRVRPVRHR